MNKYRITNPNNKEVRDCKSRTTEKIVKVMKNHEKNRNEEEYQFYYTNDHLGSSTYITNKEGQITQTLAYLPYGEDWIDLDNHPSYLTPYKFNGKEKDQETGYQYFGARYLNPKLSIWLSVDPMSDKYPHLTSYHYCSNSPVNRIDPTGMEDNPIYGTNGNLLGTDNKGLKGDAIIMDKKHFKQGMEQEEAIKHNLGYDGLENDKARESYNKSWSSLPGRPDYDGYLTKAEADAWWQGKSGQPLYVDQSKIDLPGITTESFDNKDGASVTKNFIWGLSNTGKAYGTLKLTLKDAKSGTVHIGGSNYMDEYDFRMDGRPLRDVATWVGRPGGANDGKSFLIYGYGKAKVPVVAPKNR